MKLKVVKGNNKVNKKLKHEFKVIMLLEIDEIEKGGLFKEIGDGKM